VPKRIAIVQSSYIPWKGYFDLIASVDEFVLYDDAQFTKRDWRNRNRIKTPHGLLWLTVPVVVKGRFQQSVRETQVTDVRWTGKHWRSIRASYARAPFFEHYQAALEELFLGAVDHRLSAINHRFLIGLCRLLGIETRLTWSMDYEPQGSSTASLVGICLKAGANEYLSGPSARAYLDEQQFQEAGIAVTYADYTGYAEYPQLHPPFVHGVSVIDLIVHTGPDARRFMLMNATRLAGERASGLTA
jgi:hypothetical protein